MRKHAMLLCALGLVTLAGMPAVVAPVGKLEADVARPMLGWRNEYFTRWPYVKNLVPHNSLYNYGRMQEVWLDK